MKYSKLTATACISLQRERRCLPRVCHGGTPVAPRISLLVWLSCHDREDRARLPQMETRLLSLSTPWFNVGTCLSNYTGAYLSICFQLNIIWILWELTAIRWFRSIFLYLYIMWKWLSFKYSTVNPFDTELSTLNIGQHYKMNRGEISSWAQLRVNWSSWDSFFSCSKNFCIAWNFRFEKCLMFALNVNPLIPNQHHLHASP